MKSALRKACVFLLLLVSPVFAQMTPQQTNAFETANTGSSSLTSADLLLLVRGILTALIIIWLVWVVNGAYRAWGTGNATSYELGSQWLRALFIAMVFLTVIYW